MSVRHKASLEKCDTEFLFSYGRTVAFARRTSLGDPAFVPDQEEKIKTIMSKAFAKETLQKINDVSTSFTQASIEASRTRN